MKFKNEFEKDLLSRKGIANKYIKFINELSGNHTIALDAPWGSGKTKFIEFMSYELEKQKDIFINYNAWKNDYTNEPFLSLMNDFFEQSVEKEYIGRDKLKKVITHTFNSVKLVGKSFVKAGGRLVIGSDAVKNLGEAGEEIVKAVTEDTSKTIIDNTFNKLTESKKSRESFTEELNNTINKILTEKQKEKMVIIIDELDRCKPTFAIELLENIKHLFDIQNLIFLIAVDKIQLSESIKSVYGSGFDSKTYLHRFFDIELHLPNKSNNDFFSKKILEVFDDDVLKDGYFLKLLPEIIDILKLTLRDFERILYETLLLKTINSNCSFHEHVCIVLLIIKYKVPIYYKMISENSNKKSQDILNKYYEEVSDELYHLMHSITYKNLTEEKLEGTIRTKKLSEVSIKTLKLIDYTI